MQQYDVATPHRDLHDASTAPPETPRARDSTAQQRRRAAPAHAATTTPGTLQRICNETATTSPRRRRNAAQTPPDKAAEQHHTSAPGAPKIMCHGLTPQTVTVNSSINCHLDTWRHLPYRRRHRRLLPPVTPLTEQCC